MSGHSKWSTIKRQKGAADIKRGQTFTKIANSIALIARAGNSGDPEVNPKLRDALEDARKANMPKENIQRAIDRGLGKLPGQTIEEVSYEAFGPGRVAFYIEGVTDNKLRTNQEIKTLFERSGGNLGGQGSTAYMFDKKGECKVQGKGGSTEEEMLQIIDLGAEDVEDFEEDGVKKYLVYSEPSNLNNLKKSLTEAGFKIEESGLIFKPNTVTSIEDKGTADKVLALAEKLEDHDDIQKVFANFDINEELIR